VAQTRQKTRLFAAFPLSPIYNTLDGETIPAKILQTPRARERHTGLSCLKGKEKNALAVELLDGGVLMLDDGDSDDHGRVGFFLKRWAGNLAPAWR